MRSCTNLGLHTQMRMDWVAATSEYSNVDFHPMAMMHVMERLTAMLVTSRQIRARTNQDPVLKERTIGGRWLSGLCGRKQRGGVRVPCGCTTARDETNVRFCWTCAWRDVQLICWCLLQVVECPHNRTDITRGNHLRQTKGILCYPWYPKNTLSYRYWP